MAGYGLKVPRTRPEFTEVEELIPRSSRPAAIVAAFERLIGMLPSGWTMTDLRSRHDDGHLVLVMRVEPILENRVLEREAAVRVARLAVKGANRELDDAEKLAEYARADLRDALDDARIPPSDWGRGRDDSFFTQDEWAARLEAKRSA